MSEMEILVNEWGKFKYFQEIDQEEIKGVWKCFKHYKDKVMSKTLRLNEYTNRVQNLDGECNYLCQFFERDSGKYFAAAKPGNANNYGIKMNDDETYYCSKKITKTSELMSVNQEDVKIYFPIILDYLYEAFNVEISDDNLKEKSKYFEENKLIAGKMILKIIAMNNNGKFLYTYKTEILQNIYNYFYPGSQSKLNDLELSYHITKKAINTFKNINKDSVDIYLIKLSSFLWQKFQDEQIETIDEDKSQKDNAEKKDKGKNEMKQPLNQILYGPPGTGKTYNTINKAIEIIDNDFFQKNKGEMPENRKALKEKFEEYKQAGQIEFVTFHQSYGYEEFVEGIKAETTEKENIKYEVQAGIFKQLCEKSKQLKSIKLNLENLNFRDFISINQKFKTLTGIEFEIMSVDEKIRVKNSQNTEHSLSRKSILDYLVKQDFDKTRGHFSYQPVIAKYIFEKLDKAQIEDNTNKNYILIIDEINRGNISKIFGELITLIEESKRIGKDEALHVKLPYSNESFGVPSNLYIIGTMNTADRSIALMDTALRRRFDFEEMMPRPDLLSNITVSSDNQEINIKSLLETINKRIEYLYDRDHTIGHAYFMSLKDKSGDEAKKELDNIFKNKIIPLLQEYFYDDWEKIQIVLGDHINQFTSTKQESEKSFYSSTDTFECINKYRFIQSIKFKEDDVIGFNHEDIEDEQILYKVSDIFEILAYKKICDKTEQSKIYKQIETKVKPKTKDENEEQANTSN